MWQRLLRLLATGFNAYSFYTNPLRFIISLLCVILIPYLAYLFWGVVIVIALIALGIYFIYKAISTSRDQRHHY